MGALADEYIRLRADTSRLPRDVRKGGFDAGRNFSDSFATTTRKVIGRSLLATGLAAGAAFGLALKKGFARLSAIEDAEAKLRGLGHSAKDVEKIMVNALASVKGTAFGLDAAATLAATAVAAGIKPGQELERTLKLVADAATIGGTSLSEMGAIFNQVAASNKVQGDTINQLNERGIPILKLLGDVMGKNQGEVAELASKGKIDFATFQKAMEKGLGGAALQSGKTASGAFKNMGAAFSRVGAALLKDVFPKIGQGIGGITKWLDDITPIAERIGKSWGKMLQSDAFKNAVADLKEAVAGLTGNEDLVKSLEDMAGVLPKIVSGLATAITKYTEFATIVDKFENQSFGEGDKVGGPVGRIVKDFGAGGTIERALIQFRGFIVRHVRQGWADVKAAFVEDSSAVVVGVSRFVGRVVGWFAGLPRRVMQWVRRLWSDARNSFTRNHAAILADVRRFLSRMTAFFASWFAKLKSGWNAFWNTIKAVAQAAFNLVRSRITTAWNAIRSIWTRAQTAVRSTWSSFWTAVKKTGSDAINAVRTTISRVLGQIRIGFSRGVTAIGNAWNRIRTAARTPVAFVVNTVLDNGLLRAFRAVSNLVDYGPGKNFHVSMARGGILPGYTPGRDVHRFYSPTGGRIDLSGGEGILRPELTRAIGARRLNAANKKARNGRVDEGIHDLGGFATGGIAGAIQLGRSMGISRITTYPGHHPTMALARDFMTSSKSRGDRLAAALWANRKLFRLWYLIWWRRIISMTRPGAGWRPYTRSNPHTDHVHASFYPGALSRGLIGKLLKGFIGSAQFAGISARKYLDQVTAALAKLKGIGGGKFGQMAAAGARLLGDKVKDKITSLVDAFNAKNSFGLGSGTGGFIAAQGGSNRAIGRRMMLQRWPASQWPALNSLWTKESGWRTTARNPSSGAYGIPQALPASKMASAGADWRTNPATQIKWGLGYIASRYGSPLSAWRHSQRTNWYGMGGVINEPVMGLGMRTGARYGFGERGPETVTPGRGGQRPITIMIDLGDGLRQIIQGEIDDNDEFKATVGRAR